MIKMRRNAFEKFIFLLCLISLASSDDFYFGAVLTCVQNNSVQCLQWNSTVQLKHYESYFNLYSCFPASTFVLAETGPKLISQLKVHDKILAYDKETGKNQFSEVLAWLHRDTVGNLEFDEVETKENYTFSASERHNIGFINNGKIDFKFAESLNPGDKLMGLGKNLTVSSADKIRIRKGLYSPMTEAKNFYIFPQEVEESQLKATPMILVHCLPQVNSPLSHENWVVKSLHMLNWLSMNEHENQVHENYVHPISHILGLFSHKDEKQVEHMYDLAHQNMLKNEESHDYYSSYNSYNSYNTYNSYNSYQSQRRHQQKRKQQAVISLLTMNEIILKSKG